jgi:ABC-type phosphate transport system ATPase subunit
MARLFLKFLFRSSNPAKTWMVYIGTGKTSFKCEATRQALTIRYGLDSAQHAIRISVGDVENVSVFAVMGTTGSGKSTFIRNTIGNSDIVTSHQLEACI